VLNNELVEELLQFRGPDPSVLSVYVSIPADPGEIRGVRAHVESVLQPVSELVASRQLAHAPRESLRADVARIMEELPPRGQELLGRTIAVFACRQVGLYREAIVARPVRERAVVDETPYVRPLLAVLDESHRYCTVVVTSEVSWIYEFYMGELEEAGRVGAWGPRKPKPEGWHLSERRDDHRAEELARRHLKDTAAATEEFMQKRDAELLILGGHTEIIPEFVPFLSKPLQQKVAGTFAIDPNTMSPGQVREHADAIVEAYERGEESRLVGEAFERVAAGGLGAVGLEWCLLAVNEHAVELLLVNDDDTAPGRACDNCGWLGLGEAGTAGAEAVCPVCGAATRPTPDVIDEMAEKVVDTSGRVEHVYAETQLPDQVVAAFLRFPVPRNLT
jgi:peptide chain release factor subunit 1